MKAKFSVADYLLNVNDSMELDSGQCVAELEVGDVLATINVEGKVRVVFDDEVYRSASQFPQELRDLFHSGAAYNSERIYIDDNNWFECYVYYKNPDYDKNIEKGIVPCKWLCDAGWCDVLDGGWSSAADVFALLLDLIEEYNKTK